MLIKHPNGFPLILISLILLLSACASSPAESNSERNQTGKAELDGIIEKVLADDTAGLRSLFELTQTKCTNAEGLGGPPKCLIGEQEGTPVEVLPLLGPEGHFIRKADIAVGKGSMHPTCSLSTRFQIWLIRMRTIRRESMLSYLWVTRKAA